MKIKEILFKKGFFSRKSTRFLLKERDFSSRKKTYLCVKLNKNLNLAKDMCVLELKAWNIKEYSAYHLSFFCCIATLRFILSFDLPLCFPQWKRQKITCLTDLTEVLLYSFFFPFEWNVRDTSLNQKDIYFKLCIYLFELLYAFI